MSGDGKTGTVRQRAGEVAGDDEESGFGIVRASGGGGRGGWGRLKEEVGLRAKYLGSYLWLERGINVKYKIEGAKTKSKAKQSITERPAERRNQTFQPPKWSRVQHTTLPTPATHFLYRLYPICMY